MKARLAVGRARLVIYGVLLVVVLVFVLRYEGLRLPEEGCSPLRAFQPGQRLLLDLWSRVKEGDAVVFEHDGTLLLGRVMAFPDGFEPPAETRAGLLWIVADAPDCPATDSRALGPIPRKDVRARVAAGLPW